MKSSHLFYNLLTKTALLIYNETAYQLEGPFPSKAAAQTAADDLINSLALVNPDLPGGLSHKLSGRDGDL